MSTSHPTQKTGDKKGQALAELAELLKKHPKSARKTLLHEVEVKFDLTPRECEFLEKNFHG